MRTTRTGDGPISVVDRISVVLDAFNGAGPMTLAQITARTKLPRSSVHRLLEQLSTAGWLSRSPDQTYELGVKAYELGQAAFSQNRLLQAARPVMRDFAQRTGYTIQLGDVDRGDTIYFAKVNGRLSGPTPTTIGQRVPAHLTAVGKAILAFAEISPRTSTRELRTLDDGNLAGHTALSITSPAQLRSEFAQIRDRGAAFDRGEAFAGLACVGVSIGPHDHMYGNMSGLSVCGPVSAIDHRKLMGPARIAAGEIWARCVAADLAEH